MVFSSAPGAGGLRPPVVQQGAARARVISHERTPLVSPSPLTTATPPHRANQQSPSRALAVAGAASEDSPLSAAAVVGSGQLRINLSIDSVATSFEKAIHDLNQQGQYEATTELQKCAASWESLCETAVQEAEEWQRIVEESDAMAESMRDKADAATTEAAHAKSMCEQAIIEAEYWRSEVEGGDDAAEAVRDKAAAAAASAHLLLERAVMEAEEWTLQAVAGS